MSSEVLNLTEAVMRLEENVRNFEQWKKDTARNMDDMFLIIMGIIIYRKGLELSLHFFLHIYEYNNFNLSNVCRWKNMYLCEKSNI